MTMSTVVVSPMVFRRCVTLTRRVGHVTQEKANKPKSPDKPVSVGENMVCEDHLLKPLPVTFRFLSAEVRQLLD